MPLYICDECHALENTAGSSGNYWTRDWDVWPDGARGRALCCECTPAEYSDGSPNVGGGTWNQSFPKQIMTSDSLAAYIVEHVRSTELLVHWFMPSQGFVDLMGVEPDEYETPTEVR